MKLRHDNSWPRVLFLDADFWRPLVLEQQTLIRATRTCLRSFSFRVEISVQVQLQQENLVSQWFRERLKNAGLTLFRIIQLQSVHLLLSLSHILILMAMLKPYYFWKSHSQCWRQWYVSRNVSWSNLHRYYSIKNGAQLNLRNVTWEMGVRNVLKLNHMQIASFY